MITRIKRKDDTLCKNGVYCFDITVTVFFEDYSDEDLYNILTLIKSKAPIKIIKAELNSEENRLD